MCTGRYFPGGRLAAILQRKFTIGLACEANGPMIAHMAVL